MSRKASLGEFRAQADNDRGRILQMKINMLADEYRLIVEFFFNYV